MTKKLLLMLCLTMATVGCLAMPDGDEEENGIPVYLQPVDVSEDPEAPDDFEDPITSLPQKPRMPKRGVTVYQSGHTLLLNNYQGYVIELIDIQDGENGIAVYTSFIPANVSRWQLPSNLTGDYLIRLVLGNWAYVGWIEL